MILLNLEILKIKKGKDVDLISIIIHWALNEDVTSLYFGAKEREIRKNRFPYRGVLLIKIMIFRYLSVYSWLQKHR